MEHLTISNFTKIQSKDNTTVFVDETSNTMLIVFAKDIENIGQISLSNMTTITTNDKYYKYSSCALGNVEIMIIKDYTSQDTNKYLPRQRIIIDETPEYYNNITLPHILQLDKQWIYNILDGIHEQNRIIYTNDNFILVQDIKWSGEKVSDFHILAIPKRRDILSIRNLDESNIGMIENMDSVAKKQISQNYGILENNIRSYFHYHPSFWHLHIHYELYGSNISAYSVDFCKLVSDVIQNVRFTDGKYYKCATLKIIKNE